MKFNEHDTQPYDWDAEGVYVIEPTDPVEGGPDGVSNCQAKELTRRTRNLHTRMTVAEGEIDTIQAQTPIQVEAALASANTYTDGKDTVLRSDMAIADTAAIRAAKDYADQVVAALVDNSPAALNTLQELAKALGDDPNFSTTVMKEIGERMKTADVTAALAGKANTSHGHTASDLSGVLKALSDSPNADDMGMGITQINGRGIVSLHQHTYNELQFDYPLSASHGGTQLRFRQRNNDTAAHFPWREIYHTGNLGAATQGAVGLMSPADKTKLDTLQPAPLAAYKIAANGYIQMSSGPKASNEAIGKSGSGHYIVRHNIGNTNYYPIPTAYGNRDLVCYAFIIAKHSDRVEIGVSNMSGGFEDFDFELVLMPYN